MADGTLTARAINRATLARQMLLAREKATPKVAVERLAGLQAQLARPPFVGLWSRVAGFTREALASAIAKHDVVRATFLRGTLHLVSADDYVRFRAALQPLLDRGMRSVLRDHMGDLDLAPLLAEARAYLGKGPQTFNAIRAHLVSRFPKANDRALGYAVRMQLPLVQVPDGSAWSYPGTTAFALAETWLGRPLDGETDASALVLRYLAAFGPAGVADAQTWSGLGALRDVFDALRPKLRVFRDPNGRELFDLPNAPRPKEDVPAPVRFLPEFDNLVMAYDDRSRLIADDHRARIYVAKNLQVLPTFLVDGMVAGTWTTAGTKRAPILDVTPFAAISASIRAELETEGGALLRFVEPDAKSFEVRVAAAAKRVAKKKSR